MLSSYIYLFFFPLFCFPHLPHHILKKILSSIYFHALVIHVIFHYVGTYNIPRNCFRLPWFHDDVHTINSIPSGILYDTIHTAAVLLVQQYQRTVFTSKYKILRKVSCEYDRWVVETLTLQAAWHGRHAHWARLCYVPFVFWRSWITSTVWLLILGSTSFMLGHSRRVLHVFLMKYIGRWLPWVPPGSTGRFYKDDVVHNHSAHRH